MRRVPPFLWTALLAALLGSALAWADQPPGRSGSARHATPGAWLPEATAKVLPPPGPPVEQSNQPNTPSAGDKDSTSSGTEGRESGEEAERADGLANTQSQGGTRLMQLLALQNGESLPLFWLIALGLLNLGVFFAAGIMLTRMPAGAKPGGAPPNRQAQGASGAQPLRSAPAVRLAPAGASAATPTASPATPARPAAEAPARRDPKAPATLIRKRKS